MFQLFKRYLPKGLYGRAALILLLPIILLQLTVSVVFVQRHFEGVTEQLARGITNEIGLISNILFSKNSASEDVGTLSKALEISVEAYQGSLDNFEQTRRFFDLTAFIVERELFLQMDVVAVDLPDDYRVRILISRDEKAFVLGFSRERVSASNPQIGRAHV